MTSINGNRAWDKIYKQLNIGELKFDDRPLSNQIEEHASVRGNQCAMQYLDLSVSYSELNKQANQLANMLTEIGITRQSVVGIHLPNIPQYMIALVAISKIGCAGSGISPLLSPPELAHQIKDANR